MGDGSVRGKDGNDFDPHLIDRGTSAVKQDAVDDSMARQPGESDEDYMRRMNSLFAKKKRT